MYQGDGRLAFPLEITNTASRLTLLVKTRVHLKSRFHKPAIRTEDRTL